MQKIDITMEFEDFEILSHNLREFVEPLPMEDRDDLLEFMFLRREGRKPTFFEKIEFNNILVKEMQTLEKIKNKYFTL